jgi:tryptophan-rich sensory protein
MNEKDNPTKGWYDNLKKSPFTPPAYVFGPVWATLYTLMLISLIIYLKSKYSVRGLALFGTQLAVNLIWPYLFFTKKMVCISLLNVFLLSLLLFLTYIEFRKSSIIAANLLLPYMLWLQVAEYLNFYICLNN